MKRKWEVIIGIAGVILCVIFLGGFSLTITSMEESTYKTTVFPILQEGVSEEYVSESFEAVKALALWFGVTLLIVFILVALAALAIWRNKYPKRGAVLFIFAGLATLIGTQFIAFPIAFLFFTAAGLCILRKIKDKEGVENVSNKNYKSDFTRI
jgi:phosphoglycerol transferase MdoB-like AlkP superfamily enzyme